MKKILQLSTYPITQPLHGGQIRVSQIRKYFEANNCQVKSLSLSEMSHSDYDPKDDFLLAAHELSERVDVHFCTDFATSLLSTAGKAYEFLKKNIHNYSPDIILLEQVWLWPAIKKLLDGGELSKEVMLVYSSQNIEYKTKRLLLESHDINGTEVDTVINGIYKLEKDLCELADMVITCTSTDADEFIAMGAKKTIICNNGVERRKITPDVSVQLQLDLNGRKYALFVGSAYPPNALGFWEMMGDSLAWLPPECIVLCVGGVSSILESYMPEFAKLYSYVSMDRIKKIGFVSEELLASLVDNASVILLPITIGGGSNLKTAEAIASGRPVVATTTACRGFDFVTKLNNFVVTDDQAVFIQGIRGFLYAGTQHINDIEEIGLRESVYWEESLTGLKEVGLRS